MAAFFSAGASFTPSPVIATTWPLRLKRGDHAELVGRGDASINLDVVDLAGELLLGHGLQLGARDHPPATEYAQLAGDGLRRQGVIAGDHHHLDAGPRAPLDRRPGLGPGRVDHADESEQRHALLGVGEGGVAPRGHRKHAQRLGGHPSRRVEDCLAVRRRERPLSGFGRDAGARVEDELGAPLE